MEGELSILVFPRVDHRLNELLDPLSHFTLHLSLVALDVVNKAWFVVIQVDLLYFLKPTQDHGLTELVHHLSGDSLDCVTFQLTLRGLHLAEHLGIVYLPFSPADHIVPPETDTVDKLHYHCLEDALVFVDAFDCLLVTVLEYLEQDDLLVEVILHQLQALHK